MLVMFAVKIVRLKVYMTIASPMTYLHSRSQVRLKLWLLFNLRYLGHNLSYYIQTGHDVILMHGI